MILNRRSFIELSVIGSSLLIGNKYELSAQTQQYRVRKNVECLTDSEKAAFKKVIQDMKNLSKKEPKNHSGWNKQAEIHVSRCGDNNPLNVHSSWLFLPWHRAYLYYFERICQTLSGNPDFALPYWDWTNPKTRKIPDLFLKEPLLHDRPGIEEILEARDEMVGQGVINDLLTEQDFWGFVGRDPCTSAVASGRLESTPHDHIHNFIGGDMQYTVSAAFDPIFWLHHANVDRLWVKWMRAKGTPQHKEWSAKIVDGFYNPDDTQAPGKMVGEIVSTYDLGYRYDDEPTKPLKYGNSSEILEVSTSDICIIGTVGDKAKIINGGLRIAFSDIFKITKPLDKSSKDTLNIIREVGKIISKKQTSKQSPGLLMVIELEKPVNPKIVVRLFINAPENSQGLSIDIPSYLTTVGFFESGHKHDKDKMDKHNHDEEKTNINDDSRKFIINITSKIKELFKLSPSQFFSLDKTTISIVPVLLQGNSIETVGGVKIRSLEFILVR